MFIRSTDNLYVFVVHLTDMFSYHIYLHYQNITDVFQLFARSAHLTNIKENKHEECFLSVVKIYIVYYRVLD